MPRLTLADLAFAVLLWALLIVRYGYTFGTNDQVELLPYVLFLHDHSLFAHDFFMQSLHASQPNERTVMAHLLLPFAGHLAITLFLLHFSNTVLMILGLIKLAARFISNKYVCWMAVFTSVLLLNDKGLGNVDLYSPAVQAGDLSCMIIVWALNVFLDRRYLLASAVMAVATFVHVLEGFDVMAVLCAVMLIKYFVDKEITFRQLASFFGIYLLTAGIYLLFIFRAKTGGTVTLTQQEIFWIMFVFRHPHHFIFSTFPVFNKVLFVFWLLASVVFYPGRSKAVFQFIAVGTLVLIIYIVAVDFLHISFIANFQWYKVVQWIKFLGIVAAFGYVYYFIDAFIQRPNRMMNSIILAAGVFGGCFMFYQYSLGTFARGYKQYNENEIALCIKVKDLTPRDAVFIQPFEMTALKFYGQRSSYVEFKAIAKNQKDLALWYKRVQEVFGLDYHIDNSGFWMEQKANAHLDDLNDSQLDALRSEGVTHIICKTGKYQQGHKLILSENGYFVYQL